jgi:hypothetical protein
MRLLVDECVDERLRLLFTGYDCETARIHTTRVTPERKSGIVDRVWTIAEMLA